MPLSPVSGKPQKFAQVYYEQLGNIGEISGQASAQQRPDSAPCSWDRGPASPSGLLESCCVILGKAFLEIEPQFLTMEEHARWGYFLCLIALGSEVFCTTQEKGMVEFCFVVCGVWVTLYLLASVGLLSAHFL